MVKFKKTQFKELIATIKKTIISYIAILLFLSFGISLFSGISLGGKGLIKSMENMFVETNFRDLSVYFPYGASDDDLLSISKVEGVDTVEGSYECYPLMEYNGKNLQTKLISVTEKIDVFSKYEGVLPTNGNEIAVEEKFAIKENIKIGDTIVFKNDDDGTSHFISYILNGEYSKLSSPDYKTSGMKYLNTNTFTVTALVETSTYVSKFKISYGVSVLNSVPIEGVLFANKNAFDSESFAGYSNVLITSNSLRKYTFYSNKYKLLVSKLNTRVKFVADRAVYNRYGHVLDNVGEIKDYLFDDAKSILNTSQFFTCSISTRENNAGCAQLEQISLVLKKFKYSMVLLFVVITLLITYSTVSRIIYENRNQIGMQKALGFTNSEIILKYVLYSLILAVIGTLIGSIVSRVLIAPIIIKATLANYTISKIVYSFSPLEFVLVLLFSVTFMVLITLLSISKTLKTNIVSLIRKSENNNSKKLKLRKLKLFNKLNSFDKTIINNVFTDKKRVISTIISIVGITSLIVTSLTMSHGINGSISLQFNKLQSFDHVLYYDNSVETSKTEIKQVLDNNQIVNEDCFITIGYLKPHDDVSAACYLTVVEVSTKAYSLYGLNNKKYELNDEVWISCSYAKEYHLKVGDTFTFVSSKGLKHVMQIGGIFKSYLQRTQVLMNKNTYERVFNEVPTNNAFLLDTKLKGISDFETQLNSVNGYLLTQNYYKDSKDSFDVLSIICNVIIFLYLTFSILMAFLVLMNLLSLYIEEKKNELITLMINGYSRKHAEKYIYFDTAIITAFGSVLGAVCGVAFGLLSLRAIASHSTYFLMEVDLISCLIGIVLTVILSFIITVLSLKKIKKFKINDISQNA